MTTGQDTPASRIDTSRPHPARVYDFLLGGKDNYLVDQKVGEKLPEVARRACLLNRAFMHRASAWVAGTGVDQFLDIGTGIPTEPNLHQIVQAVAPAARVVYTDNDPVVLRHAEALLTSTPQGVTSYIEADVRDPEAILAHAREVLDFDRPIALSLIALMHFLTDEEDPYGLTRTLVDALPSGSYLILSHGTADFLPAELTERIGSTYREGGMTLLARDRAQVERFFEGLEFVAPGLVSGPEWYKDTPAPEYEPNGVYVGVARVR
ncbi:SAM-dependent methyltransferase [Streptomyces sp. NBC_00264]|uniref:SAM-dependent methyltransferase n=1 Tax=unclassified Streptomyces TaxID=2593676 RepID=UPI000F5C25B4|nr:MULTISPECIES: SAM-dependent methyltransferase [unclassified Streptomyces]WSX02818.1 SAM-dependent methyltransferase [Streptomyces sp. NBC_00987]MCX5161649.1 SAM-dependent methyltransferase [Streptomyces sp. NBC_00305]MCX5220172.1 SAM-dependent methyltransferase [Streptomyces sp. NBC_00264]RPK67667.1 S-adenosyl methyltransferase [Streptomyces sp. ADI95-17]WSC28866.1 SAM-dependent methyltransferase [Streptomyces sp. NBC_01768]